MPSPSRNQRPDTAGQRRGRTRSRAPQHAAPAAEPAAPPVVGFISLGCSKNLVDSEKMLGQIAESGAIIAADESLADTIVVNTCGFLDASRQEGMAVIRELVERKQRGELKRVIVAGCLVQRDGARLSDEIPGIDALVGVNNRDDVPSAVWGVAPRDETSTTPVARQSAPLSALPTFPPSHRSAPRTASLHLGDYHPHAWTDRGRLRLTPRHYAYARISEGCDQKCTFCTIPSIRGPMHCKPPDEVVAECRELIADGAREILLIGQDTTSYGRDIGYSAGLSGLLRRLDRDCDGLDWLRLMYVYPTDFTDEMIDAIAECARVVKYIDIPLQHINDRVLRSMGRRVTRAQQEALLEKLRRRIPGVTIRTTFIVGFPGETDAEFDELVQFVQGFEFDAVGAFRYSLESSTPSAKIGGHVAEDVKQARHERLMLVQQETVFRAARRWVGRTFDVVIDGCDAADAGAPAAVTAAGRHDDAVMFAAWDVEHGQSAFASRVGDGAGGRSGRPKQVAIARHAGQAPEVDAVCRLPNARFEPGEVLTVRCTDTRGYDLLVEPVRVALPRARR